MKTFSVLFSLLLIITTWACGQHESETHDDSHFQHHRLALFTGYGLIPGAINESGKEQVKVIPVLGIDYEYWFNHKIALGLHNDLELASYSVENEKEKYLEREYAFVTALVFLYEPLRGLTFFAGPGYEFEKNHNFAVFKIGTDLTKSFKQGWSTGITLSYDVKEVNSSFSFGLCIGKRLGKH